nr:NADH dehydrogenase subunit 4L [Pessoaiella absita]
MMIWKSFFLFLVITGLVKMSISKSLMSILISIEMSMSGLLFLFASNWWVLMNVQFLVLFLVVTVLEGTVGVLLVSSLFRKVGINSLKSFF